MNDTNLRVKLSQTNIACTITKDQLRNLAELLQERANTAAKLEIESLEADEGVDPTQLEKNKKTLAESFTLKFTVFGADGNQLFGTLKDVFDSPNFPEHLVSLFVQSDLTLRAAHNYYPRNSFRLSLDFTRPALFNFDFLPSQRTPNTSSFDVEGYDVSWANGLFSEITRFFESKRSSLAVLHKHTVYDLLLWLIGIPATFWICFRASQLITDVSSVFLQSALYVYVFFMSLILFRVLFHYLRWVFPLVEYRTPSSKTLVHRTAVSVIGSGLLVAFLYDVLSRLLS